MKTKLKEIRNGKKVFELEFEQKDCDELNAQAKEIGLDKFPDYKPLVPSKSEFLFG